MISPAQREHATDVALLWNSMISETLNTFTSAEKSPAETASLIATRPGAFWVAHRANHFAGFVTFGAFRSGPGYARTVEHSILVTPEVAGQGVADALISRAEAGAIDLGMHVMVGAISAVNSRALRFHARHGFSEVGRLPEVGRKADQWLDLVLVQKILRAPTHSR